MEPPGKWCAEETALGAGIFPGIFPGVGESGWERKESVVERAGPDPLRSDRPAAPRCRLHAGALPGAGHARRRRRGAGGVFAGAQVLRLLSRRRSPGVAAGDRPERMPHSKGKGGAIRAVRGRAALSRVRVRRRPGLGDRGEGNVARGARPAARRIPRGDRAARNPGTLLPGDRRHREGSYRHRDVAAVGGRLDYLHGRAVAALVYQRRLHVVNVFVWPEEGTERLGARTENGYNEIYWKKNGWEYWVVSDLNSAELREFAATL